MHNMGKLKALAYTGLALVLAGLIGFGCANKKEQEMSRLNSNVSSAYAEYCLNKRDIKENPNESLKIKSRKNYDKSTTEAYNFLRTAYLKELQGFPDSTEVYFDKMTRDISNTINPELKDASTLMLLLGPGYYYFNQGNAQKTEEVLDLAESMVTNNTPKGYLRSLHECLGIAKENLGKNSEAEVIYSLALKNLKYEDLTSNARNRVEKRLKEKLKEFSN